MIEVLLAQWSEVNDKVGETGALILRFILLLLPSWPPSGSLTALKSLFLLLFSRTPHLFTAFFGVSSLSFLYIVHLSRCSSRNGQSSPAMNSESDGYRSR